MTNASQNANNSRRSFIKKATLATVVLGNASLFTLAADSSLEKNVQQNEIPWYRRVTRWGQINITLDTAANFDIAWWRKYWKKTQTQGIVLNAGGIYAYYPTKVPYHFRAPLLGAHDLFGDLCHAAHEDGLVVFARMDSGSANEDIYNTYPDWFAINAAGKPYVRNGLYTTCINGPYYSAHIPAILKEISTLYKPEGITDNSWEGLGRNSPCYCENCNKKFRDKTGKEIPRIKNWDDPAYREWIKWSFDRRSEQWAFNNKITKSAGGTNCTWSGMISSSISGQSNGFINLKEICSLADVIMIDAQARNNLGGFQQNSDTGKRIHGLVGWGKIVAESMAIYGPRISSKPAPEAQMWMYEGIAGGIVPWWHTVSGYSDDRRRYATVEPVYQWQKKNEKFLYNRTPVATVGVVWSQDNTTWYGRDDAANLVDLPARGITQALVRARIPYIPVNADHIERDANQLSLLILPNIGAMTDEQVESVKRFVGRGGGLIATGESSLYDKFGDRRPDYALANLFGAHIKKDGKHNLVAVPRLEQGREREISADVIGRSANSYLRLAPELGKNVDGPHNGTEPAVNDKRHPALKGFDETDILPFGGSLEPIRIDPGVQVLLTFIPAFPILPPENAWMREPKTNIQGLVVNTTAGGSRIAFMPADIDRQFARNNYPDHGNLLANLVCWASKDDIPLIVEGAGLVDFNIYHQPGRLILHIANLVSAGTWRSPIDEFIPIGPITIRVRLTKDVQGNNLNLLVCGQRISTNVKNGWCEFQIKSVLDHEVAVIT